MREGGRMREGGSGLSVGGVWRHFAWSSLWLDGILLIRHIHILLIVPRSSCFLHFASVHMDMHEFGWADEVVHTWLKLRILENRSQACKSKEV